MPNKLYVYTCTDHAYHFPVGVASVVVAESEGRARQLLRDELRKRGLDANKAFTLQQLDVTREGAYTLREGNY